MFPIGRLSALAVLAAAAVGCATTQARTPAPMPMLDPPPAPVKVIIPSQLPEPQPVAAPQGAPVDLAEPPPPAGPPTGTRNAPPPTPPATPPPTPDPQVLRPSTDVAQAERETRRQIQVARLVIDRVKREELGADGRAQFDEVQRFIRSSEEALKVRNYLLARQLADKAALLASVLIRGGVHPIAI